MIVLHILLLLLKIIGILLLILLGLILVILLVPIRYSFEGEYHKEEVPRARVQVTWFVKLLHIQGSFENKRLSYEAKVAWKTLLTSEKKSGSGKGKKKKSRSAENAKKKVQTNVREETTAKSDQKNEPETAAEKPVQKNAPETAAEKPVQNEEAKAVAVKPVQKDGPEEETALSVKNELTVVKAQQDELEEKLPQKSETKKPREDQKTEKEKAKDDKAKKEKSKDDKAKKEKSKDDKAGKKKSDSTSDSEEEKQGIVDKINGKIDQIRDLYKEYRVAELIPFVKDILISVIKHILPRKLEGHLAYGFDDPSTTGKITAAAAVFYPAYANTFALYPDFTEECLDTDCKGSGRIRLGFFVWILIRLLLNKHVRHDIALFLKR